MKTGFPCENLNTRKSWFYYSEWVYCKDARSAQKSKEEESLILKTFQFAVYKGKKKNCLKGQTTYNVPFEVIYLQKRQNLNVYKIFAFRFESQVI